MCGFNFTTDPNGLINFNNIKHRGPDSTNIKIINGIQMGFHRLSITGLDDGEQPFHKNNVYVMCNGEIYNYKNLISNFSLEMKTNSDCEVILHLYLLGGIELLNSLRGEYAFVIADLNTKSVFFGRDFFGVRPLFFCDNGNYLTLSSELKGLPEKGEQVSPGFIFEYNITSKSTQIHKIRFPSGHTIKYRLEESVRIRIPEEVPYGFLLSGGLDSSLVLSIASRYIDRDEIIHVFTIGFSEDAPDVINAKKVIEYLKQIYGDRYVHHVYIPTVKDGIDAIPNVIKSIETYDTTTVRASTPMWLMAKYIREYTNIKVILTGEGSDELCGGYLYFHYAPSKLDFDNERISLLCDINHFDGLRADRTLSAFGLECRVPFLDNTVASAILSSDEFYTTMKETKIEKYKLRKIFEGYLPEELLWRTKEAFSDAVSSIWKEELKKYAEFYIENLPLSLLQKKYKHLPPQTPEEIWYRTVFESYYPNQGYILPHLWLPKWVNTNREPSATVLKIHAERINK